MNEAGTRRGVTGNRRIRERVRERPLSAGSRSVIGAALLVLGAPQAAAQSAEGQAQAQPPQSVDAFRQQAVQLGAQRCAGLFSIAGQSVTAGSTYGVQVQADGNEPDAHAVQGLAGITYNTPELNGQAAGVVLAAPVGQGCEGQLVRVAPFQQPCAQVLSLLPAGSTPAGDLSGVPLYNLGTNQGQAMLVGSGASCVVVTVARVATAAG